MRTEEAPEDSHNFKIKNDGHVGWITPMEVQGSLFDVFHRRSDGIGIASPISSIFVLLGVSKCLFKDTRTRLSDLS